MSDRAIKNNFIVATIISFILTISLTNVFAQNKWEIADENIIRLEPKKFIQLPQMIIDDLEKRSCTIPQSYIADKKHNVIQGEFKKKGQKDWAVLCSTERMSTILIYWNGLTKDISSVAAAEDKAYLQGIGEDKIGFSRIIEVADAKYIYDHYEAYGGVEPPEIEHQGINDIFAEKASTVLYFNAGDWLELQGAD